MHTRALEIDTGRPRIVQYVPLHHLERRNCLRAPAKAIQTYEFWLASFIQSLELDPIAVPPTFSTYGKTLAILECASHPSHSSPSEAPLLQGLSEGLTLSHAKWSSNNAYFRHLREVQKVRHEKKKGLVSRVVMAVFGGATLIVPMLIMVLDQRRITTVSFLFSLCRILEREWRDVIQVLIMPLNP